MKVEGKTIDDQTRCIHYNSELDIIAIKFKCCGVYYPCYSCHQESVDHHAEVWKLEERNQKAILCGVCKNELTTEQYFSCNNSCPHCQSRFNPKCSAHYHLYFEIE